jgi:hypothetical protein
MKHYFEAEPGQPDRICIHCGLQPGGYIHNMTTRYLSIPDWLPVHFSLGDKIYLRAWGIKI